MNINIQYGDHLDDFPDLKWDICFYGNICDDRSEISIELIKNKSKECIQFSYESSTYELCINKQKYGIDDLDSYFDTKISKKSNIIIDCTTLGVPEILILLQKISDNQYKRVDALYIEPRDYRKKSTQIREFELSNDFYGFNAIPGFSLSVNSDNSDKVVFFCGYESERINRAFEDLDLDGDNTQLVFGVPAFQAGWEINTFSNNILLLENRDISENFYYCGASNPIAAYEILLNIYRGLEADEKFFIAPLGTKPMSLGACLFMTYADKEKVAILYDHPIKKLGRSSSLSRWNLYNIIL